MSDFSIGGKVWPGISKLTEEAAEVGQVCGKLIGSRGVVHHWDGSNLKVRLEEEIADVVAAAKFVVDKNGLDEAAITERIEKKLKMFEDWHASDQALAGTGCFVVQPTSKFSQDGK